MKLSDLKLSEENHFVGMEYHGLILNRTLLVLLTETHLIGILGRGVTAAEDESDPLTAWIFGYFSVHGDLNDPHSYLKQSYLDNAADIDLLGNEFLKMNRANFRYLFTEISEVSYNPKKKWGMGYYPHDGKVYLTAQGRKREFIILGNQSGRIIAGRIKERAGRAHIKTL